MFASKRKAFNSKEHALPEEALKLATTGTKGGGKAPAKKAAAAQTASVSTEDKPVGGVSKAEAWRSQSDMLRQAMKAARDYKAAIAAGETPPPPPASSGPDPNLVPCPNCGRSFSDKAAERHIPKCSEIKARPKALVRGTGRTAGGTMSQAASVASAAPGPAGAGPALLRSTGSFSAAGGRVAATAATPARGTASAATPSRGGASSVRASSSSKGSNFASELLAAGGYGPTGSSPSRLDRDVDSYLAAMPGRGLSQHRDLFDASGDGQAYLNKSSATGYGGASLRGGAGPAPRFASAAQSSSAVSGYIAGAGSGSSLSRTMSGGRSGPPIAAGGPGASESAAPAVGGRFRANSGPGSGASGLSQTRSYLGRG